MNMSLALRLPREIHLCRSSSNVPRLPSFLEMLENPHVLLTLNKVTRMLSTREKSIKIEHLTWYLQCFVRIIISGPEVQKYEKLSFSSRAAWFSSLSGYVGTRTGICIPTNGD